jgi:hypothetical protein
MSGCRSSSVRQREAHLPAAGELAAVAVEVRGLEAETGEHRLGAALVIVTALVIPALARRRVVVEDPLVTVALRIGGAELLLEAPAVGLDDAQLVEGVQRRSAHRAPRGRDAILRQVTDAAPLGHGDGAVVGLLEAGNHAQQRRLAGAVGADQRDAVVLADEPARVVEHGLGAKRATELADREHPIWLTRIRRKIDRGGHGGRDRLSGLSIFSRTRTRTRSVPDFCPKLRVRVRVGVRVRAGTLVFRQSLSPA